MPKIAKQLTERAVAAIKTPGRHPVGGVPGLHLRIDGGHVGWVLRVQVGEKRRDIALGTVADMGLAEAREKARNTRDSIRRGELPVTPARQRRAALADSGKTFAWCAEQYIAAHQSGWKNAKHAQQWQNTLATYANPVIGSMATAEIDTAHIMRVLEPIWIEKAETASRLRGRIEQVLDWARVHGYRTGENPARWRGHLDKLLAKHSKTLNVKHHAALPWRDMAPFMADLLKQEGTAARALEFIILTAVRTNEAICATWQEIDLESGIWTIPVNRMKAGKEHVVPLSEPVVALLKALPRIDGNPHVFVGRGSQPLSNMAGLMLLRRMGHDGLTVHGFRSTFRDWAGEATHHPREVIEHALAHQLKDKAEAAYQRGSHFDKRRALMQDWALHCDRIATAEVLHLPRRA